MLSTARKLYNMIGQLSRAVIGRHSIRMSMHLVVRLSEARPGLCQGLCLILSHQRAVIRNNAEMEPGIPFLCTESVKLPVRIADLVQIRRL